MTSVIIWAAKARLVAADPQRLAELIGVPVDRWPHNCHSVSLALVKTGEFGPEARVARGFAGGVRGQHSWIALGDPYDWRTPVVDATHPGNHDTGTPIVVVEFGVGTHYIPQGFGVLPEEAREQLAQVLPPFTGPVKKLTPKTPLSLDAELFLEEIGPMDFRRWCWLASNMPVGGGWPAAEIIAAMDDSGLAAAIPVDILGMLTDRNPRGLYLREETS